MCASPLERHQAEVPEVLSSGEAGRIKGLYKDLGTFWWEANAEELGGVPVLSLPETASVVCGCLDGATGLMLDAGCGPNPAVAIGLASGLDRQVVAMDIGWGTVRIAQAIAAEKGAALLGVVGDVERLPFRDRAFDGVVCDDTVEHLPDDAAGVAELARVALKVAPVVLATPNRQNALVLRRRMLDGLIGRRRLAREYFVSTSHLREYTWHELEELVRPVFRLTRRIPVGWSGSRKRRFASSCLSLPGLHRFSQMIVLQLGPR